jgi:hypothetical protein
MYKPTTRFLSYSKRRVLFNEEFPVHSTVLSEQTADVVDASERGRPQFRSVIKYPDRPVPGTDEDEQWMLTNCFAKVSYFGTTDESAANYTLSDIEIGNARFCAIDEQ